MTNLEQTLDGLWWFPILWIGGVIAASIAWRRINGKPIFAPEVADAVFVERWTSGRVRGGIRAIGGASNCLLVAVTKMELIVSPQFPFTLMFLPEIWGLEHRKPLSRIKSVTARNGLLGRTVDVVFDDGDGMVFRLRNPDAFLQAMRRA